MYETWVGTIILLFACLSVTLCLHSIGSSMWMEGAFSTFLFYLENLRGFSMLKLIIIIIHCGWNVTCNSLEICRLRDLTFFSDDHQIFILDLTLWVYCIVRLQMRIIIIVYHSMSLLYYRNWAQLSHGSFSVHINSISSYFYLIFCDPRPLSSFTLYPIDL